MYFILAGIHQRTSIEPAERPVYQAINKEEKR